MTTSLASSSALEISDLVRVNGSCPCPQGGVDVVAIDCD